MDEYNLDMDRENRLGFPEVVYGQTKSVELLTKILSDYQEQGKNALASRLQPEKGEALLRTFPGAFFDALSGSFLLKNVASASCAECPGWSSRQDLYHSWFSVSS